MKQTDLSPFGLDANQSKTYLALLQMGSASILEISKNSGINRSMLYEVVDSLIELGLVYKSVRGKKVRFVAREPEALQALLTQKLKKFEKLLPDLKTLVAQGSTKPSVTLHEGLAGIKQVYLGATHSKEQKLYAFVGVESLLSKTTVLETFWDEEFKNNGRNETCLDSFLCRIMWPEKSFEQKITGIFARADW